MKRIAVAVILNLVGVGCGGTDDDNDSSSVAPQGSTSTAAADVDEPDGSPASGELIPTPEGMRKFKSAEVECSDTCQVRLKVQSQCPTPKIVMLAFQLKKKVFYQVWVQASTEAWQTGDIVSFTPSQAPQVAVTEVLYENYENQSGVFYTCP